MIVEKFLVIVYNIFNTFVNVDIPLLPEDVYTFLDTAVGYIETGSAILSNFFPMQLLLSYLGIMVVVEAAVLVVQILVWIYTKIPFVGASR